MNQPRITGRGPARLRWRSAAGPTVCVMSTNARACTLIAFVALMLAGCGDTQTRPPAAAGATAAATTVRQQTKPKPERAAASARSVASKPGTALSALGRVPVKGRAPKTGYRRDQFGDGWASVDGCDTRDRILTRDLHTTTVTGGCEVQSGVLDDPYTATAIRFQRGGASEVDIDHVVALGDAWQKGAQSLPYARRVQLANDPLNLLAADASANRQKGDGDAATWLPANTRFRCVYVARQIAVKRRYTLWVTSAERDAMRRVLGACPGQRLPTGARPHVNVTGPAPQQTAAPTRTPQPSNTGGGGEVFANCDAVRAAGRAPLRRGDPAYDANPQLDRDKDGVACE